MTEMQWTPTPAQPGRWSAAPPRPIHDAAPSATVAALTACLPDRCPSGVNGVTLCKDDHVALFVMRDDSSAHLDVVFDYVCSGIDSTVASECLSLELTKGQSVEAAALRLESRLGHELPNTVDIRGWERNAEDYTPEHFDRPGMWRAMASEQARLERVPNSMLRVASADCTAFMQWLANPVDYVTYEHELAGDLGRILEGRPFLQLCVFKIGTLRRIADEHSFDASAALLDLVLAHNRVLLMDSGQLYRGAEAERRILREAWRPKSRAGWTRWARVLARASRHRR